MNMGVYKDRQLTESLLPNVIKGYEDKNINELQEPQIITSREVVNQMHVIIKSVRDMKWAIERDNIELNDDYIAPLASVIDNLEVALNVIEPISDKLDKYTKLIKQ